MIKSDMVTMIARGLGNRVATSLTSLIAIAMDTVQRDTLENGKRVTQPWFLVSDIQGVSSDCSIDIPTDFLREIEGYPLKLLYEGEKIALIKNDDLTLSSKDQAGELEEELPTYYSLLGSRFYIYPSAALTVAYDYRLKYIRRDTLPSSLADGATNLWLTHTPLLFLALCVDFLATFVTIDDATVGRITGQLPALWADFEAVNETRQHINMNYSMGNFDDN